MCTRSPAKAEAAIVSIKELYPNAQVSILEMDHTSLASVVAAVGAFLAKETKLHGLVCNAGIMAVPFAITRDGHESQWQTNYLAHWIFTEKLLPVLLLTSRATSPGIVRIVNVSSDVHERLAPKIGIDFEDISQTKGGPFSRYGQSKLANILHAKTLNTMYGPESSAANKGEGEVWTAAVHPGHVDTQLNTQATSMGLLTKLVPVLRWVGAFIKPKQGAYTQLWAVAGSDFKADQSGDYFVPIAKKGQESRHAMNPEMRQKLEEWTRKTMSVDGWMAN